MLAGFGMPAGEHGRFLLLICLCKITKLPESDYFNTIIKGCQ